MLPWWYGMKSLPNSDKTKYKPGHQGIGGRAFENNTIRIRKRHKNNRLMIRTGVNEWKYLHIYNWEKINGPVPEGWLLEFIDGNPMNCELSNLRLISRKEHLNKIKPTNHGEIISRMWRDDLKRIEFGIKPHYRKVLAQR